MVSYSLSSLHSFLLIGPLVLFTIRTHAEETTLASTITVTVAASTSPLSPSYTSPTDLQSSTLNSTNFYRYEHDARFLSWNDTLASYAQDYAAKCIWAHSHGPYGENLAIGYPSITASIDAWGDERSKYDFNSQSPTGFSEATGHFTQLVWKSTTSTGCAAVDCSGKNGLTGVLVVCEYYPPGNIVGNNNKWFVQNVQEQVNQGQGFNYAAATSGVGGPSATKSATGTSTVSASQPGNTMGAATGLVVGANGGRGWWAFAATIMALCIASGMA